MLSVAFNKEGCMKDNFTREQLEQSASYPPGECPDCGYDGPALAAFALKLWDRLTLVERLLQIAEPPPASWLPKFLIRE